MLTSHPYYKVTNTIIFVVAQILLTVNSSSEEDEIHILPGQPPVDFRQYAGYITVDDVHQSSLFYYFVEAEGDYMSKPLVLWLQGVANMIYLESPVGVGFSFSSNQSFYEFVNDEITAKNNFVFLQRWIKRFPKYRNNSLFIAGESYGGHYAPQLAKLIIQNKTPFNLKGIVLGNPVLEFSSYNSVGEYLWSHGLISDSSYQMLNTACNYSQILRQKLISKTIIPVCEAVHKQVFNEISEQAILADISLDSCLSTSTTSHALQLHNINFCGIQQNTENYFNRKDVKEALHAKLIRVMTTWSLDRSNVVNYYMHDVEIPIIPILKQLLESDLRVFVYSGDQDAVIPLTGTRTLVNELAKEMELNITVPYGSWFQGGKIAGRTQVYGDNILSFATVKGGGHMAPFSQPERSLAVFKAFLRGKPFPGASQSS